MEMLKMKIKNMESNKFYGEMTYIIAYNEDGTEVRERQYFDSKEDFEECLKFHKTNFDFVEIFTEDYAKYHGIGFPEGDCGFPEGD